MKVETKIEYKQIADRVKCEICTRSFQQITATHLLKHNISMMRYKELFSNSNLVCSELLRRYSKIQKKLKKDHPEQLPIPPDDAYKYLDNHRNKANEMSKIAINFPINKKNFGKTFKLLWKDKDWRKKKIEENKSNTTKEWKEKEYRKKTIDGMIRCKERKKEMLIKKFLEYVQKNTEPVSVTQTAIDLGVCRNTASKYLNIIRRKI